MNEREGSVSRQAVDPAAVLPEQGVLFVLAVLTLASGWWLGWSTALIVGGALALALLASLRSRRVQLRLQRKLQLLQAVADGTSDAIFVKDLEGRYLFFNEAAAAFVGHPAAEVIGLDDHALFTPADVEVIRRHDLRVIESGRLHTAEEVLTSDGVTRTYLATKAPYRVENGRIAGIIGVSRDITAQKEAEHRLRAERDRFEGIMEAVPFVICSFEQCPDGRVRFPYSSPRIESIYGRTPEELAHDGSVIFELMHPEDAPRVRAGIERAAHELSLWRDEFRVRSPRLGEIWVEGCSAPVRKPDGALLWHGYIADATAARAARTALEASEERLRLALSAAAGGVWDWNLVTGRAWWSPETCALYGLPAADGVELEDSVARVHPDDRERVRRAVEEALVTRGEYRCEFRVRQEGPEERWRVSQGRVQTDRDGKPTRLIGISIDVTGRRLLEEQLRQSQKMEAVGRLGGGIAHDFNNLLTVIAGYSDLLLAELSAEAPERESLAAIREAGQQAAGLTSQLLAFSRKALVEPRTLDLNESLERSDKLLRRVLGEDVLLTVELAPDPCLVTADPVQIDQLVLNLAVNARDAMPHGGRLTLSTRRLVKDPAEPGAHAPAWIELAVADSGHGMSPEVQARIFEPFFTTKPPGHGTGLGLAVVHGIVQQIGGRIEVHSRPGEGTRFLLRFPQASPVPAPADPINRAPERGSGSILLVEDEEAVLRLTQLALETQGYSVLSAPSGPEALARFEARSAPIDLLITDVVMPGMNGRELAARLRERQPGLPVLFVTGYTDDEAMRHALRAPDCALLRKPFRPSTLGAQVRELLARRSAPDPASP